jgi:hypothetical protein
MANTNIVNGANFVKELFGGSTSGSLMPFVVPATDATALFIGDVVKLTGDSAISDYSEFGYLPAITQAAAGDDAICGVVEGFGVNPDNLTKIYRPGFILATAWARISYVSIFTIQSTGTVVSGDIGQCADIVVGSGNTFTGMSGMQLDHSTLSSANGQLKIVGISSGSELGLYTKLNVVINESFYKQIAGV